MTRRLLTLLALIACAALAGCGEKTEQVSGQPQLQPFTIILDYFPNADHAAIYAAQASGEFRRAGLDVKIVTPTDPSVPLRLLQAGRGDVAISYEPELLLARDKSPRLVAIGALVQKPLTTLMAIGGSHVRSVGDLRGKTVGTAGIPYQAAYLKTILQHAGVPQSSVKQVDVGFNLVPAMLTRKVDATLGAFWNYEGVDLAQRGKHPTILRMETLGVPTYNELVLVVPKARLDSNESAKLRRFIQALARGAQIARDDPARAADALVAANPSLNRKLQLASIRATAPIFFPGGGKPFGWQDPAQWLAYGRWMHSHGLLLHDPLADNALTNEFLPGQGLQTADSP